MSKMYQSIFILISNRDLVNQDLKFIEIDKFKPVCYNFTIARETVAVVSDTSMKGGVVMEYVLSFTLLVLIIIIYIKK